MAKAKTFKRKQSTITINVAGEDYEGLQIVLRKLKISDYAKLIPLINQAENADETNTDLDDIQGLMEGIGNTLADFIVSWNMEDENGPVPVEEIAGEELELVFNVFQGWIQAQVGVDAELGKDSRSGETSPMPNLVMEAL